MQLRPWQREILNDIFELRKDGRRRYRRGLLMMPRKNVLENTMIQRNHSKITRLF
jgi:phage terminase large subunit-like protein